LQQDLVRSGQAAVKDGNISSRMLDIISASLTYALQWLRCWGNSTKLP
jgi:hypothetical protein